MRKKVLSLIFPQNIDGYLDFTSRFNDEIIEPILFAGDSFTELEVLSYSMRIASGNYVGVITKHDKILDDFFDEFINVAGQNKDVIVFPTVNDSGEITKYSIMSPLNIGKKSVIKPIQYFHLVKKRITDVIVFRDNHPLGALGFYSKKIQGTTFNEAMITKPLIQRTVGL